MKRKTMVRRFVGSMALFRIWLDVVDEPQYNAYVDGLVKDYLRRKRSL